MRRSPVVVSRALAAQEEVGDDLFDRRAGLLEITRQQPWILWDCPHCSDEWHAGFENASGDEGED